MKHDQKVTAAYRKAVVELHYDLLMGKITSEEFFSMKWDAYYRIRDAYNCASICLDTTEGMDKRALRRAIKDGSELAVKFAQQRGYKL